jgi:hypothetical protein
LENLRTEPACPLGKGRLQKLGALGSGEKKAIGSGLFGYATEGKDERLG